MNAIRRRRWALLVSAGLLAMGCAAGGPPPAPVQGPSWPPPPDPARIHWLQEIRIPDDLGVKRGWLGRMADRLLGEKREPFLVRPTGLEVTRDGRLLVTDPGNRRVLLLDLEGHRVQRLPAERTVRLPSPIDVAEEAQGRFLVTDSILGRILRFDDRGRFLGDLGTPGLLDRPTGIAVDHHRGRIYVTDTTAHQIVVFDLEGVLQTKIGHRGDQPGEFNFPTHLCLDGSGNLYITDAMNFRVQILDPEGQPLATVGTLGDGPGTFAKPKGVAVDSADHLYVVDALFDNVQILARDGRPLLAFGHSGNGPGGFWLPTGIAIDGSDRIFVADTYNHRIQVFQYSPGRDEP